MANKQKELRVLLCIFALLTASALLSAQDGCSEDKDGDGWTAEDGDCNDMDELSYPGADELCDDHDHNCDELTDYDADGDGLSDASCGGSDCNDTNASTKSCSSCADLLAAGMGTEDGVYTLDPCGDGVMAEFYCDMTYDGGGWTIAGMQDSDATTAMGIQNLGTIGTVPFSSDLSCLSYSEIKVFNQTYDITYQQVYTEDVWDFTEVNFSVGDPGYAFKHGTYGPSDSSIMMGCVDYLYYNDSDVNNAYACDSDSQANTKGHIADYAGEYCSGGRLDYTWAWTDGSSCYYRGELYVWGYGIR